MLFDPVQSDHGLFANEPALFAAPESPDGASKVPKRPDQRKNVWISRWPSECNCLVRSRENSSRDEDNCGSVTLRKGYAPKRLS